MALKPRAARPARHQTSPFPSASGAEATARFGLTPRRAFEFVGWKCSRPGCVNNATSVKASDWFFPQVGATRLSQRHGG